MLVEVDDHFMAALQAAYQVDGVGDVADDRNETDGERCFLRFVAVYPGFPGAVPDAFGWSSPGCLHVRARRLSRYQVQGRLVPEFNAALRGCGRGCRT